MVIYDNLRLSASSIIKFYYIRMAAVPHRLRPADIEYENMPQIPKRLRGAEYWLLDDGLLISPAIAGSFDCRRNEHGRENQA